MSAPTADSRKPIAEVGRPKAEGRRLKAGLLAGLLLFSGWSVYTRYVDLHNFDLVTNMPFRDLSMMQYNETLAGTRPFPYQWRVLAFWMVRAGHGLTSIDPHVIDIAIKTLALAASTALLYVFATTIVSGLGALLAAVLYLFVTAAAFSSEGYAIYFTNDYLAVLAWFAGVVALRKQMWLAAALAAFAGAWAKETALLIVFLAAFEAWRQRAPWSAVIMCAVAFAIPTAVLRTVYPAPLQEWVWWDTFKLNVPFIVWQWPVMAKSLRDNLKVLLFLNVIWFWAWRAWRRASEAAPQTEDHGRDGSASLAAALPCPASGGADRAFVGSLALTLACYAVLAWMVVYIRELRHMLPFTIFVLPMAVAELEALLKEKQEIKRSGG